MLIYSDDMLEIPSDTIFVQGDIFKMVLNERHNQDQDEDEEDEYRWMHQRIRVKRD
jgi:hypothetical protein